MLKKVLLTLGLLVAANMMAWAQGTLKGTVTDAKTGEPMPFVNVIAKLDGQQVGGAQTDFDGIFTIRPLEVGTYSVEISYVGYQKFVKTGVVVKASGFTVCNAELDKATETLKEVKVVAERVPLIEVGTPESGQRISDADIAHMPGTSVESIVAAVGGVSYDDGGTGTARGESGMVTMQGGVRKRTGITAPKEALAEIQVILGGTPASIGEAIGGTQIITLKPPSSQFKGLVKYETFLDYRLRNTLTVYLTGPIVKQKKQLEGGGVSERAIVGFRLTGQATYINSSMYRAKDRRYRMVNDELVYAIEQAPISYDPLTGVNYTAETQLHSSDFVEITRLRNSDFVSADRKPSLSTYSVAMEGAVNVLFTENVTMTVTGEFSYSLSPSVSTSYLPLNMSRAGNGVSKATNAGITVDFTQHFPDPKTTDESSKPIISNVMYNITAMYSRYNANSYNENFGDDVFKYGHIGKFVTEKQRTYEMQYNYNYNGTEQVAMVQNSWYDYVDPNEFVASKWNPVLANYTAQLYTIDDLRGYLYSFDNIRQFKGLVNGDSPQSIYSLFSNVGVQSSSYAKQENNYYYVQAKASAQIKKHDLEVGFQYDQYTSAYYGLGAYSLWTIMRQSANAHITQLDYSNPHEHFVGSTLYVDYDRKEGDGQTLFDQKLREALNAGSKEWLDIDRYSPEEYEKFGGLSMFSTNELFNSGHSIVSFYGYDHTGEKYSGKNWNLDDFFDPKARGHENFQYLPVFSPIYMAGYIQDKFFFQDLIFNVGVRVDRFDGNQMVLKDPYLLYESYTVGDLRNGHMSYNTTLNGNAFANNAQDSWVVYVDDPSAATPNITGYRNGSVWYDANGVEVSSPSAVASPISGKPTPFRTADGQKAYNGNESGNKISSSAFKDYEPQIVVMPRVAFSFPVGVAAQFKASYDIIARRPSSNWQADYLSYLYMTQISSLNNPNLKPERITNYEVGFQQMLNKVSAISISAYYKETRDLIQLVQYAGADPNQNYYSYDNLDFKTIKGFTLSYDLRQSKNIRINANYTLQYAEGTGLSSTTMSELIKEGYTTLKMLNPISDDRRHEFKANVDFRYAKSEGFKMSRKVKDENGQYRKKDIYPLENFGVNFMAVAQSGRPYTKAFSNTQSTIVGSYRGARLPWGFYFNVIVDKSWFFKVGKRQTILNAAVTVNNLFDIRNVVGVFSVTGNPDDNGYLTDPETQSTINSYLDPQSYRDLYTIYLINNVWNYCNPRTIKLGLTYSF